MIGIARIRQAGALTYQIRDGDLWLLLVQSKTLKRWIFPKGNLEPGMSPHQSASFEAFEEAGVLGTIESRSLGSYSYRKQPERGGELCRVRLYPMAITQVLDFYPERNARIREWMTVEQALDLITEEKLKSLLAAFARRA